MKTFIKTILTVVVIVAVGLFFIGRDGSDGVNNVIDSHPLIRVTTPVANTLISNPLRVSGQARGNWYFEASFPVRLLDGNGKEIAITIAQAQDEWMTTEFVPFEAKLIFAYPTTTAGTLVLQKDNASGLPEHDDELHIPVRFEPSSANLQTIRLYYYNEFKDKDASGNILCSAQGLEPVERQIPITITPIQEAIKMLPEGELSSLEEAHGVTTGFPLEGVTLETASLASNGVLTLTLADPQNKTSGGSCRVSILVAQIEATAKAFPLVKQVRILPNTLFQP